MLILNIYIFSINTTVMTVKTVFSISILQNVKISLPISMYENIFFMFSCALPVLVKSLFYIKTLTTDDEYIRHAEFSKHTDDKYTHLMSDISFSILDHSFCFLMSLNLKSIYNFSSFL